jgi:stage V sporulation protein G
MEITEVKVFPIQEEKLRAFVSIVIDRCFMVNDIKVIQGRDGLFISMPSRRKKNGDFKDIAHPLNNDTRRMIEERILTEYEGAVGEPVQRRVHRSESEAAVAAGGAGELPKAAAVAMASPPPGQTLDEVQEQHLSDSFWTVR